VAENGGDNVTEFVKRNMKFLFTHELARQFNLSGQRNKHAFKPLELFNVMYGRYSLQFVHFGRPFVKRFAQNYRTVVLSACFVCLSVTLLYCGQTVGWIKMPLGK